MGDNNKILKFRKMIERIWDDLGGTPMTRDNSVASMDDSVYLAAVYDYEKLNDYGKIIMEQVSDLENNEKYLPYYRDAEYRIEQLEWITDFINSDSKYASLKFVFWALMILAVDDTDKEKHLSMICDFAKIKYIKDSEMEDIVQIIRFLFHEETSGFLASASVRICFKELLRDFDYREKDISSPEEGLSRLVSLYECLF